VAFVTALEYIPMQGRAVEINSSG